MARSINKEEVRRRRYDCELLHGKRPRDAIKPSGADESDIAELDALFEKYALSDTEIGNIEGYCAKRHPALLGSIILVVCVAAVILIILEGISWPIVAFLAVFSTAPVAFTAKSARRNRAQLERIRQGEYTAYRFHVERKIYYAYNDESIIYKPSLRYIQSRGVTLSVGTSPEWDTLMPDEDAVAIVLASKNGRRRHIQIYGMGLLDGSLFEE